MLGRAALCVLLLTACAKGSETTFGGEGGSGASGGAGGNGGGTGNSGNTGPCVDEICNGVDDDCDGLIDEIDGDDVCPGQYPGATDVAVWTCTEGECVASACVAGKSDVDGDLTNGCECTADTHPAACGMAVKVDIPVGQSKSATGVVETGAGADWVVFNFIPTAAGQAYHPKIELEDAATSPYAMDVHVDCNGTAAGCSTTGVPMNNESGVKVAVWEQNFANYMAGAGCCSDMTTRATNVKVKIYRKDAAAAVACDSWSVVATNTM